MSKKHTNRGPAGKKVSPKTSWEKLPGTKMMNLDEIVGNNDNPLNHLNVIISPEEEAELHEQLTVLHRSYFMPGKPISVTFQSIGMGSIQQLRRSFAQYDVARIGKKDESKEQNSKHRAFIVSTLLGLKNQKTV